MASDICMDCEQVYDNKGRSRYCPICRRKRTSEHAKKIGLNKLGNDAYSKQLKMLKNPDRTEFCGNCIHFRNDTHHCRNTDSKHWGTQVSESGWCSRWKNEQGGREDENNT